MDAEFSGYYFYMNTNVQGDFQICISVPWTNSSEMRNISNFQIFYGG